MKEILDNIWNLPADAIITGIEKMLLAVTLYMLGLFVVLVFIGWCWWKWTR